MVAFEFCCGFDYIRVDGKRIEITNAMRAKAGISLEGLCRMLGGRYYAAWVEWDRWVRIAPKGERRSHYDRFI